MGEPPTLPGGFMDETTLANVCHHEAGHAIAHLAINSILSRPETIITTVWVDPERLTDLVRNLVRKDGDPTRQAVRCLAGWAAECRHRHGPDWFPIADELLSSQSRDVCMAREALAETPWPALEMLRSWDAARALVVKHWPEVQKLADVLAADGSISGPDVEKLWATWRMLGRR